MLDKTLCLGLDGFDQFTVADSERLGGRDKVIPFVLRNVVIGNTRQENTAQKCFAFALEKLPRKCGKLQPCDSAMRRSRCSSTASNFPSSIAWARAAANRLRKFQANRLHSVCRDLEPFGNPLQRFVLLRRDRAVEPRAFQK